MAEAWRPLLLPPLEAGVSEGFDLTLTFPEAEDECLDDSKGVTWDLMNGARACLAACKVRNLFRIWVSKRDPSWTYMTMWQTCINQRQHAC